MERAALEEMQLLVSAAPVAPAALVCEESAARPQAVAAVLGTVVVAKVLHGEVSSTGSPSSLDPAMQCIKAVRVTNA